MLGEKLATDREPKDCEEGDWGREGEQERVAGDDSILLRAH